MSDGREGEMEEDEHAVHQFQVAAGKWFLLPTLLHLQNTVHMLGYPVVSRVTFKTFLLNVCIVGTIINRHTGVCLMHKDYHAPCGFCSCLSKSEHC